MTIANDDQARHWNDPATITDWVDGQAAHDAMLAPFIEPLLDAAAVDRRDRVLDVGCGCGATTIAAALRAVNGSAHGVDLSRSMLGCAADDAARQHVDNATFEQGDVQVHPFDEAHFDAVISRFGVMFFADLIHAFTNLHRATRSGGRLAFVCWQPLAANEWLLVPGAALAQTDLPLPDTGGPGAPGMFALADPDHTRHVLRDAGWQQIDTVDHRVPILLGGPGNLDTAVDFLATGSLGRAALAGADPSTAARAISAVRDALAAHLTADGVQLGAAVWLVTARA